MNAYWGSGGIGPHILNFRSEWSFTLHGRFPQGGAAKPLTTEEFFWVMTPCSVLKVNLRFGGTCLHRQSRTISQARNQHAEMMLVPKLVLIFKILHGIISYKMYLFITTVERTSNLDLEFFEYSFSVASFYCPSIENGKWLLISLSYAYVCVYLRVR
jgi:hypothetical protein